MSLIFFGSSEFSLKSLEACLDSGIPVKLVVTTPDVPKGRGLKVQPTPVKIFAQSHGLRVISPEKLKSEEALSEAEKIAPDFFVVASYGKIIPPAWLKIPKILSINVHPSLLPKWRGAAPLNWPILSGEKETGLCLMEVVDKLDAGDIFFTQKIAVTAEDDASTLSHKLADLSYNAVKELLSKLQKGEKPSRITQNEAEMTYARKLTKTDGKLDWKLPAEELDRRIRGLLPWPGASTSFEHQPLQILKAKALEKSSSQKPGTVLEAGKQSLTVQAGTGSLEIQKVKPAGKNEMSAGDFARGKRISPGAVFGDGEAP